MATLLSCEQVSKSFGSRPLFQGITLGIGDGDRVGLIGPNGSGKSTLVRILAGLERPDSGTVSGRRGLRVGYLAQEEEFDAGLTCEDAVAQVLSSQPLDELEQSVRISASLGRVGFTETNLPVDTLSGGWRKRLALACQLALEPDIMLLDEPTNHLDLEGIEYLEQMLRAGPLPFLLVSHDRYFLENVTNRLIELNPAYPDGCLVAQGSYSDFLIQREEFLQAQARQQESLESRVRREVEWLRKSAPARSTKPGARIREAGRLLEELDELKRRNSEGRSADLSFSATKRRTKELVSTKGLTMALGGRSLFSRLNLVLSPGMRMGVVGPNGGGKTTLLRLLNGDLAPDHGEVRRADGLRTVYFCQDREHLRKDQMLKHALAPEGDKVIYRDKEYHVISWAKRFLFRPEQMEMPVGELSGGEQARVLIAQLMLRPADLLLLDEPTNDLDIPTLEVLEESLREFPGAVMVVTHDRYLLDRVATEVLAVDGRGGTWFVADFHQWEEIEDRLKESEEAQRREPARNAGPRPEELTRSEQRDWKTIEAKIEAADEEVSNLEREVADPEVASDHVRLQQAWERLEAARARVSELYARWQFLEEKVRALGR